MKKKKTGKLVTTEGKIQDYSYTKLKNVLQLITYVGDEVVFGESHNGLISPPEYKSETENQSQAGTTNIDSLQVFSFSHSSLKTRPEIRLDQIFSLADCKELAAACDYLFKHLEELPSEFQDGFRIYWEPTTYPNGHLTLVLDPITWFDYLGTQKDFSISDIVKLARNYIQTKKVDRDFL